MAFEFDKYFNSLVKLESRVTTINEALVVMLQNPGYDLISVNMSKEIYINPLAFTKDDDGDLYVEFRLDRDCDAISDCYLGNEPDKIKSLEIIIGNKKIPLDRETVLNIVGSTYTNMIVRATMKTIVSKVTFNYKSYVAQTKVRRSFVPGINEVFKSGNIYYEEFKAFIK